MLTNTAPVLSRRQIIFKCFGLVVTLILPLSLILLNPNSNSLQSGRFLSGEIIWLLITVIVLLIAKYGEKDPLDFPGNDKSILNTFKLTMLILISLFISSFLFIILYTVILKTPVPREKLINVIFALPTWKKLTLALRAGIVEEIFFRAYAITRIFQLTRNRYVDTLYRSYFLLLVMLRTVRYFMFSTHLR